MRGRPSPLNLCAGLGRAQFNLTESGTFCQEGVSIGRLGTQIASKEPISPVAEGANDSGCSTRPSTTNATTLPSPSREDAASSRGTAGAGGLFEVCMDDLECHGTLGHGCSGVVRYCVHRPTGDPLVVKVIPFPVHDELVRKSVMAELRAMHLASHPNVVTCYQSFLRDGAITLALEFMDCGSLEGLFRAHPDGLPEPYLCKVARQVLEGLSYLHEEARVVHRDIKPSNLLLSTRGDVKIADFGVAGQISNDASKMCTSWVGTVSYMSPERIRGEPYKSDTDIWSLGLSLMEGAVGRFPYAPRDGPSANGGAMGFWDVLDRIVEREVPTLPPGRYSAEFEDFLGRCLQKDGASRASAQELLRHPWLAMHLGVQMVDVAVPIATPRRAGAAPRQTAARAETSLQEELSQRLQL